MTIHNKMDRQLALEAEMRERGVIRYRSSYDKSVKAGRGAETEPGMALIKTVIGPLEQAIAKWKEDCASGRAGRRHSAYKLVHDIPNDMLAFITAKHCFNFCISETSATAAYSSLGDRILDEVWASDFVKKDKRTWKNVNESLKKRGITRRENQRAMLRAVATHKGIALFDWTTRQSVCVGALFVHMFLDTTKFVEIKRIKMGRSKKQKNILVFTDEVNEWLDKRKLRGELLKPFAMPMLVEPLKRDAVLDTPYHSEAIRRYSLVKNLTRDHQKVVLDADLTQVLSAVNQLDKTSWKVSKPVLDTLVAIWERGGEIAGLPGRHDKALPKMPKWLRELNEKYKGKSSKLRNAQLKKMEKKDPKLKKQRDAYNKKASAIHTENCLTISKRVAVQRIIEIATRFKDEPALYFPHDLDFRGRIYDIPVGLHPQGADYSRGLLVFAEGKPVNNTDAMRWLMIHGANCYGFDKVGMDERCKWVEENLAKIRACVEDPIANLWWSEADKPFGFLAWCFDYVGVLEGKPSHVPVAMDGSCNGLQHFSAMLRDKEGGKAVNLVPNDKPSDIYAEVARETEVMLQEAIDNEEEGFWMAETWLSIGINRKITKRPTMVMPYGGTSQATLQYVTEAWAEMREAKGNPFGENDAKACNYLGSKVHKAVRRVVKKAELAMSWLQAVARICAKRNIPLKWTTPSGFVAFQRYRNEKLMLVETHLSGRVMKRVAVLEDRPGLSVADMTTGIAPNFVHSLDAAALILTVNAAAEEGVTHFAMIHDSYGTHAADTNQLAYTLREQFVKMYTEHDVLQEFLDEVKTYLPEEDWELLPPIPEKGRLNLNLVLDSEFFFA